MVWGVTKERPQHFIVRRRRPISLGLMPSTLDYLSEPGLDNGSTLLALPRQFQDWVEKVPGPSGQEPLDDICERPIDHQIRCPTLGTFFHLYSGDFESHRIRFSSRGDSE